MNGKFHVVGQPRKCLDCGKVITDGGLYWCMSCFVIRQAAWKALPDVWFETGRGIVHVAKPTAAARWN